MEFALQTPARTVAYLAFLALVASLFSAQLLSPVNVWFFWAALLLGLTKKTSSLSQQILALIAAGFFLAFIASASGILSHYTMLGSVLLMLICMGLSLIYASRAFAYLFQLLVIFVMIAPFISTDMMSIFLVPIGILSGAILAAIAQVLFYVASTKASAQLATVNVLRALKRLAAHEYACLLQADYPQQTYLFERRVHQAKHAALTALDAANNVSASAALDRLYAMLLACGQIRHRVSDHTTFGLCKEELQAMDTAAQQLFIELIKLAKGKPLTLDTYPLADAIKRLEENNQHILQVSAAEPLAFVLFIQAQHAFLAQCEDVAQALNERTGAVAA